MAGGPVVRNVNAVRKNLKRLKGEVRKAAIKAAEDNIIDLAERAVELAPRDEGTLENSVDPEVKVVGGKVQGKVTFSAKNPKNGYDYALIQHEDLIFNHTKGEANYLEKPLRQNAKRYKKHMEDKTKEALG